MKIIKILFCKIYESCKDENKAYEWTAVFLFAALLSINAFTICKYFRHFNKYRVEMPGIGFVLLSYVFFTMLLFEIFIRKKKYLKIYEAYKLSNHNFSASIITIVYVSLTLIMLFSAATLKGFNQ